MTREQLEALAEKYQAKADKAYRNYQETGITRYDREYSNNDELASALRMAARAADDSQQLVSLRATLSTLGSRAADLRHSGDMVEIRAFLQEVATEARIRGLIREV